MLKVGIKRRRTKHEIESDKVEAELKEAENENRVSEIALLKAQLASSRANNEDNAIAHELITDLCNKG